MIAIIGAGPAGLIAAEHLAAAGHTVTIFDQMAAPARKFLLAGRGGLNLTHSEPAEPFLSRYGAAAPWMAPALAAFPPASLTAWCEGLGQPVFTGSSGRIFPRVLKAAPLLRAWLGRLAALGVQLRTRHRWLGWTPGGALLFETQDGPFPFTARATLLAMGGASWPRTGSDGAWTTLLARRGVPIAPLRPANCGVTIGWSPILLARQEGAPLKRIAVSIAGHTARGEAIITRTGLEGGPIYALSTPIRAALDATGTATLHIDLRPDQDALQADRARGGRSLANFLRQSLNLAPPAIALVQEALHAGAAPARLSTLIKALPLRVTRLQPIARAISTAGGIGLDALDENLMITSLPGVFAAGEMLDWDAPTGGYLLQGCFSTGVLAARGMASAGSGPPLLSR